MSLLDQLGGMLQQYTGSNAPADPQQAPDHFQQAAAQASPPVLAGALSQVFHSSQTGTFGQNISQLFGQSNPEQRAGILNQLMQHAGPGMLSQLGGFLGGGAAAGSNSAPTITPEMANRVPPQCVEDLANHAQQQNPSIVDQASQFYSQHPTLVKALGAGAAILALRHMASNQ